jgi:DNA-directed RNA polymerase specialized sigma24 family protein
MPLIKTKRKKMQNQTIQYSTHKDFNGATIEKSPNLTKLKKLVKLKKEGDDALFYNLLAEVIPNIRKYTIKKIITSIKQGYLPNNKYDPNDIIDQLFIETYDHIENLYNEKEFYIWLYQKTDQLVENIIIEKELDALNFRKKEESSKPEQHKIHKNYNSDEAGNLLMLKKIEHTSCQQNENILNTLFLKNKEQILIEKVNKNLNTEEVKSHIAVELSTLPFALRTVFELYTNQYLKHEEIAQIMNTTIQEVEQLLNDSKKALQISFFNRYDLNS